MKEVNKAIMFLDSPSRRKGLTLASCIQIKDTLDKGDVVFLSGSKYPTTHVKILEDLGVKTRLTERYNNPRHEVVYDNDPYEPSIIGWTQEEKKLIGYIIEKV